VAVVQGSRRRRCPRFCGNRVRRLRGERQDYSVLHLHWFRLHLGRTSTSFTNDALNLVVVDVDGAARTFVWCSARRRVKILELRVVGEAQRVCLQVYLKRVHNFRLVEFFWITGRKSASITSGWDITCDTHRSKPASAASVISTGLRCLVSHDEGAILADVYYINLVA